jgi:hypothetical protein
MTTKARSLICPSARTSASDWITISAAAGTARIGRRASTHFVRKYVWNRAEIRPPHWRRAWGTSSRPETFIEGTPLLKSTRSMLNPREKTAAEKDTISQPFVGGGSVRRLRPTASGNRSPSQGSTRENKHRLPWRVDEGIPTARTVWRVRDAKPRTVQVRVHLCRPSPFASQR